MATWWPTAYLARDALRATACREFLYLIQDYEPAFYAASSYSVLARATYDLPFRAVFNGASLREHFRREDIGLFGRDEPSGSSIAFEPAVDRSVFRPLAREGRRRLLFYARPRNARNAFELGLKALRVAVDRGAFSDEWEFFSIGDQIPALDLGRGKLLQPIPWLDLQDYAALLGRSEVLLSLMLSPHPSYPPLEMAATGGTVLTNAFGVKTAASLSALSNRIIAVEPEIDLLADGLAAIAAAPRTESSTGDLNLPSTWDESLEPVIDWLHRSMADITGPRHVNVRPKAH